MLFPVGFAAGENTCRYQTYNEGLGTKSVYTQTSRCRLIFSTIFHTISLKTELLPVIFST